MALQEHSKQSVINYIKHIQEKYVDEYKKLSNFHENLWQYLSVIAIVLGFLPALVSSLKSVVPELSKSCIELLNVIPPLIASMFTTILITFKTYDKFKLRERGRLFFNNLVTEAHIRFAECKVEEDYTNLHQYLRRHVDEEQNRQMGAYFDFHKDDGKKKNKKKNSKKFEKSMGSGMDKISTSGCSVVGKDEEANDTQPEP